MRQSLQTLVAPEDRVFEKAEVVDYGIIKREVESPAFVSRERAIDDQAGNGAEIPELEEVRGELEVPIELLDFTL